MRVLSAIIFLLTLACPSAAQDQGAVIGSVRTASGQATILRGGKAIPAKAGMHLKTADTLMTGADGAMGVLFRDDTSLSLGPGSRLKIDKFVFDPAGEKFSFVTKMTKGTAAYLSGQIGKLSPQSVRFKTPSAIIGIRGTRFLARVGQ